jgi:hypothetical protein
MATATAFAHVRRALRSRLAVTDRVARSILSASTNFWTMDAIDQDLRGCVAMMGDDLDAVAIHVPDADGVLSYVACIVIEPAHRAKWDVMSLADAYAIPHDVRFADGGRYVLPHVQEDRLLQRRIVDLGEAIDATALDDLPPCVNLRAGQDAAPTATVDPDGTVLAGAVVDRGAYVQVLVDVAGVETPFAMMPLFGTADELLEYAARRIGQEVRLFIDPPHALHRERGIPEGMRVIDMIVPLADIQAAGSPLPLAA